MDEDIYEESPLRFSDKLTELLAPAADLHRMELESHLRDAMQQIESLKWELESTRDDLRRAEDELKAKQEESQPQEKAIEGGEDSPHPEYPVSSVEVYPDELAQAVKKDFGLELTPSDARWYALDQLGSRILDVEEKLHDDLMGQLASAAARGHDYNYTLDHYDEYEEDLYEQNMEREIEAIEDGMTEL